MRVWCKLCGLGLAGIFWANLAFAQRTFFNGVDPRNVIYKPIDTSNVAAPLPPQPSRITLSGILSKFNIPGLYKQQSLPAIPPPGQAPSPIQFPSLNYQNTFQPVMPIPGR
jgi:hypothetical protein